MSNWPKNSIEIDETFIFNGNYCIVTKKNRYGFNYDIQGSNIKGYMAYKFYITTPTYKSKNKSWA